MLHHSCGPHTRRFCYRVLITLVTPVHRPCTANAAASVCLYRKQERPLRCRPIEWPRPTAGLWSPIPGGRLAIASPRHVPSLCFDVHATVLETQPLPAVLRAYPPAMSTDCPSGIRRGRAVIPQMAGRSAIVLSRSRSPCSPLSSHFTMFQVHHCPLSLSIDGVPASAGIASETGRRSSPPSRPRQRSNADHTGKKYIVG